MRKDENRLFDSHFDPAALAREQVTEKAPLRPMANPIMPYTMGMKMAKPIPMPTNRPVTRLLQSFRADIHNLCRIIAAFEEVVAVSRREALQSFSRRFDQRI